MAACSGSTTTASGGGFSFNISSSDLTGGILLTDATDKGSSYYQANSPVKFDHRHRYLGQHPARHGRHSQQCGPEARGGKSLGLERHQLRRQRRQSQHHSGVSVNILSAYTLDGNISATGAGSLTTNASTVLSGSSNVTLTGSTVTLSGAANLTGTLTVTSTSGQILLSGFGSIFNPIRRLASR